MFIYICIFQIEIKQKKKKARKEHVGNINSLTYLQNLSGINFINQPGTGSLLPHLPTPRVSPCSSG